MAQLAVSASFEYPCYGSKAILNILIIAVRGPTLGWELITSCWYLKVKCKEFEEILVYAYM